MKATSVVVIALFAGYTLAQPIVILKSSSFSPRGIIPAESADLESREFMEKVGSFLKDAATNVLLGRGEDGHDFLEARDLYENTGDLETRKIHVNFGKFGKFMKGVAKFGMGLLRRGEDGHYFLQARDLYDNDGDLLARDFGDDEMEARDFDDEYLEARDFDDGLEARDFDDELEVRDFDNEYFEARGFDEEPMEARDLEYDLD